MSTYVKAFSLFSRNIRLLLIVSALLGFGYFGIYSLLLNLYLLRLGYGPDFIGQVNAVGPLALAVASLPAGVFSRRYGARPAMVVGCFGMAIGMGLLPLSGLLPSSVQSVWILGANAFSWFFAGTYLVSSAPFMMGSTSPEDRNYAFSVQSAMLPVFGFAGNLVGGVLPALFASLMGASTADPAPYGLALMLAAGIVLLTVPTLWKTTELRVEPAGRVEQRTRSSAMPLVLIVVVAAVFLLRVGSEWTMRIFSNVYLDTELATPTAVIGLLLASGQLFGLAALWAPLAISRFGKERTIILGTFGMALAFVPLLLIAHLLAVGVGFIAMIALASISAPAYGVFSQESVRPEWRTTISSAMMLSLGVGIAVVALGGGRVILNYGYTTLFAIGALLAVAGTVIFAAYFRGPRTAPTGVALAPVAPEANVD